VSRLLGRGRSRRASAVRVAAAATLTIAVIALGAMALFNIVATHRLVGEADTQLRDTLSDIARSKGLTLPDNDDKDAGSLPVILWRLGSHGRVLAKSVGPALPASAWPRSAAPYSARVGRQSFRLLADKTSGGWLVAGQSLTDIKHIQQVLLAAEAVALLVLIVAVFLAALTIGLKASRPVEQTRRRQLELTADASHELRTPLSVIEAETGLALSAPRAAAEYAKALQRVAAESRRLRTIVDDLLWLARFDSAPASPAIEPVDVTTIAEICADRFSAIACSRGIELSVRAEGDPQAWITAPPEWIDRLAGVLVDNACKYAAGPPDAPAAAPGAEPTVLITVGGQGSRVSLTVDDSGPGVPEAERARLFDRFYRVAADGGGYGLGLAIADAVVRASHGRWHVDDSPLGGARMQVTWHRAAQAHRAGRRPGIPWRVGSGSTQG
jgi:signal transduction histidine kinase